MQHFFRASFRVLEVSFGRLALSSEPAPSFPPFTAETLEPARSERLTPNLKPSHGSLEFLNKIPTNIPRLCSAKFPARGNGQQLRIQFFLACTANCVIYRISDKRTAARPHGA